MLSDDVIRILDDVLVLGDRAASFRPDTELLGAIPEFDSMAVVSVLAALEEQFEISIEFDDVDVSVFETVASLTAFVAARQAA